MKGHVAKLSLFDLLRFLSWSLFQLHLFIQFVLCLINSPSLHRVHGGNISLTVSVLGKDCACLSNTYNQLKRLWENKDKQLALQQQQQQPAKIVTRTEGSRNTGLSGHGDYTNNLGHHPTYHSSLGWFEFLSRCFSFCNLYFLIIFCFNPLLLSFWVIVCSHF